MVNLSYRHYVTVGNVSAIVGICYGLVHNVVNCDWLHKEAARQIKCFCRLLSELPTFRTEVGPPFSPDSIPLNCKLAEAVTLLTCVQKVPVSYLRQDAGYPYWVCDVPRFFQVNASIVTQSDHDQYLRNRFQCTVISHPMIWCLECWQHYFKSSK